MSSVVKSSSRRSSRKPDSESRKPKLPSYSDQDEEQGSQDEISEEENVKKDFNIGKPSSGTFKSKKTSKKTKSSPRPVVEASSEDEEPSPESKAVSTSLSVLLAASLHVSGQLRINSSHSQFIPDFHVFFNVLEYIQMSVVDNDYFRRLSPGYCSYITTVYYGILLLFQICRARNHCNIASKSESQFARRFEREFSLEGLPIAGPLAGFFEVLGCVTPGNTFGTVCPALPSFNTSDADTRYPKGNHGIARIPPIPHLLYFLYAIRHNTTAITYVEELGYPFYTADDLKIYNVDYKDAADYRAISMAPGWSYPIMNVSSNDDMGQFRATIKRMGIPDAVTGRMNTVATFCHLGDEDTWSWFRAVIKVAANEASFFEGATNMSKISPLGTTSSLVEILTNVDVTTTPKYEKKKEAFRKLKKRSFGHTNITALSRFNDEQEFRIGTAVQLCVHHPNMDNLLNISTDGPWFSLAGDNIATWDNPTPRDSLPFVREEIGIKNPTPQFQNLISSTLYKVEGQK